jgi:hypothetical protein
MASGSDNSWPERWPRSAERGKGKAATAAAGRVGCAATVSRPPGRGLDTGLAALLDHRDGAVAPASFDEPNSWPAQPGARSAERGRGRHLPIPAPGTDGSRSVGHCRRVRLASRPRPAPEVVTHEPRPAARFHPFVSTSDLWRWLGWRNNEYRGRLGGRSRRGARPFPTKPIRPGATRLAVVPSPESLGDHRIVALRSTREFCNASPGGPTSISPGDHALRAWQGNSDSPDTVGAQPTRPAVAALAPSISKSQIPRSAERVAHVAAQPTMSRSSVSPAGDRAR